MGDYNSPGVYVEEISLLPPLVAGVSTAIPAFVGYTEKGELLKPTPIGSMLEYEALFGGPDKAIVTVGATTTVTHQGVEKYNLYYQVAMFFRNGGGVCYIVSVGAYATTAIVPNDITKGINALK